MTPVVEHDGQQRASANGDRAASGLLRFARNDDVFGREDVDGPHEAGHDGFGWGRGGGGRVLAERRRRPHALPCSFGRRRSGMTLFGRCGGERRPRAPNRLWRFDLPTGGVRTACLEHVDGSLTQSRAGRRGGHRRRRRFPFRGLHARAARRPSRRAAPCGLRR